MSLGIKIVILGNYLGLFSIDVIHVVTHIVHTATHTTLQSRGLILLILGRTYQKADTARSFSLDNHLEEASNFGQFVQRGKVK